MNWGGFSAFLGLAAVAYLSGPFVMVPFAAFCIWLLWVS